MAQGDGDELAVLILGCRGMLGSACMNEFRDKAMGCDYAELDIADRALVLAEVKRLRPKLVLNCAAATDVDRCELDHEYASRANEIGARNLAEAAAALEANLVHISTDFVFDGSKGLPYDEEDEPNPLNYYGLSKLQGERAVLAVLPHALIVRTSWLFGDGGVNFPSKVLAWAAQSAEIKAVDDQFGSPTFAPDLAQAIHTLVGKKASGVYHVAGAGCASRFDLAKETVALAGVGARVLRASSSEFPTPALRPAYTCLDCSRLAGLGVQLPSWRDGLARYIRSRGTG